MSLASVGTADDYEVRILAGIDSRANLLDMLLHGDDLLASHVAAALGHDLILEHYAGGTRVLHFLYGAHDVQYVAVAVVGVGYNGNVGNGADVTQLRDHLRHGHQSNVRTGHGDGSSQIAAHGDGLEAGALSDNGAQRVIGACGEEGLAGVEHLSKHFCGLHVFTLLFK